MLTRTLVYGPAGGGKSDFGVSSFWDAEKGDYREGRQGLWVTFGAEDNETLGVPEANRRRFTSVNLDDLSWVREFTKLVRSIIAKYRTDKTAPLYSIVVDGFSEFDILYQQIIQKIDEEEIKKNQFHAWREMMKEFFTAVQLLHPNNTGTHLIATARRGEVKKYIQRQVGTKRDGSERTWQVEEEDWFSGAEAAPSLHGGFRRDLPHYFDYVLYCDTDVKVASEGSRKGTRIPVHQLHCMRGGDVYIKNISERQWLKSKHPFILENTNWDEFLGIVEELNGG